MQTFLKRHKYDLLACLVLLVTALACHGRYLLPGGLVFATDGDSFRQILPTSMLLQSMRQTGDLFWNWSFGLGGDAFTELTYAGSVSVFSWLQSLVRAVFGGVSGVNADILVALRWKLGFSIFKQALAMLLTYALLKSTGKKTLYALLGALAYGTAPWFLYRALLFDFMTEGMVLLPLVALCYQRYRDTGRFVGLSLSIGLLIGNNFYFGYIGVLFFALYFLVFSYEKGLPFRQYCVRVLKVLGVCAIGALVACVSLLPSINGILSSDRTFTDASLAFLPDIDTLSGLFQLVFLGSGKLGLPLFALLVFTVHFQRLDGDTKKRSLLAAFWLLMLLAPAMASIMNGFSYPTPRWHYIVIFACATALPDWLMALEQQACVKPWQAALVCGAAIGLGLAFGDLQVSFAGAAWVVSFCLGLAAVLLIGFREGLLAKPFIGRQLTLLVVLCVGLSGVLNSVSVRVYNIYEKDAETLFFGSVSQRAANEDLARDKGAFYRVEDMGIASVNYEDRPYVYGTKGVSNFASEVNGRLSTWLKKTFAIPTTPVCAGIYKSMDNRLFPEIAWGLRYKVPDPDKAALLPDCWVETATESGETVYENTLFTGFDLWYDTVLPVDEWNALSYGEKDAALLQTACVEGTLQAAYPAPVLDDAVTTLPLTGEDAILVGGRWQDGKLHVKDTATLTFPVGEDGEKGEAGEYLLSLRITEESGESMFSMTVDGVAYEKFADTMESESLNYPLETFAYHYDGSLPELTLILSKGVYVLSDCSVSRVSYAFAEDWTAARNRYQLTDLSVEGSHIAGDIVNDTAGILALSMPYREGWRCLVDGREAELLLVNGVFAGVELSPGSHHIQMDYVPPFLRLGACVTGAALLGLAVYGAADAFRRKRRRAETLREQ